MFYEDFSNPTHLSSDSNWVFPIINNFYGTSYDEGVLSSYVSKMLPVHTELGDYILIQTDCSLKDLSQCISIKFFDGLFTEIGTATFVNRYSYTSHDIYKYSLDNSIKNNAKYYKLRVNCCISGVKIYGL